MIGHKIGIDRFQMQFNALEDLIAGDNLVRVVDAFVDSLDLKTYGFHHMETKNIGASAYHPSILLKIYFYGYFNRIRSSRMLEKECTRNIEMQWLINGLTPSYHTIATFRTFKNDDIKINHCKAIKQVFRAFNRFLNGEGLFGKETAATDGTKIRAQNGRKKNFTEDKIKKKLLLADNDVNKYLNELDKMDEAEINTPDAQAVLAYLVDAKARKEKYEELKNELKRRQEIDPTITQISKTDPEARSMVLNNSGHSEIAFNVVSVVDDKNCLIAHFSVENEKDTNLLASSLMATKAEFDNDFAADLYPSEYGNSELIELNSELNTAITNELKELNAELNAENNTNLIEFDFNGFDIRTKLNGETTLKGLADKGFRDGSELQTCKDHNIITYVPPIERAFSGKDTDFTKDKFTYDKTEDTYTCPEGNKLVSKGTLHDKKDRHGVVTHQYQVYRAELTDCRNCPFSDKCVAKSQLERAHGRTIERSEHEQTVEENDARYNTPEGKKIYKRRQAMVEHPFGTIKRSWGYSYTLLKGIEKVTAEFAFVATSYNLRRAVSILGVNALIMKLKCAKGTFCQHQIAIFALIITHFNFFTKNYSLSTFDNLMRLKARY
jgi:transposase